MKLFTTKTALRVGGSALIVGGIFTVAKSLVPDLDIAELAEEGVETIVEVVEEVIEESIGE